SALVHSLLQHSFLEEHSLTAPRLASALVHSLLQHSFLEEHSLTAPMLAPVAGQVLVHSPAHSDFSPTAPMLAFSPSQAAAPQHSLLALVHASPFLAPHSLTAPGLTRFPLVLSQPI